MSSTGGPPGGGRGRGGKFSKPKRGGKESLSDCMHEDAYLTGNAGARHFTQRTNADGEIENMWAVCSALLFCENTRLIVNQARDPKRGNDDSSEDDDDSDDEESDDDDRPQQEDMTREERKAASKARKEAAIAKAQGKPAQPGDMPTDSEEDSDDENMPANPNHTAKARSQAANPKVADPENAAKPPSKDSSQLSRREREAVQAQQAKERYQKMHAEGKTDEAKADMARLKLIREKRDAEAARRQAEAEEKAAEAQAKADARVTKSQDSEDKRREAAMGKAGGKKKK